MRALSIFCAVVAAFLTAGCEAPPNAARTTSGQVIGTAARETISARDSLISVVGSTALITARTRINNVDRYQETLQLVGGYLLYERTFPGFNGDDNTAMQLVFRDKFLADNNVKFSPADVRTASNATGRYKYVVAASPSAKCVVFQQYFGRETTVAGGGVAYFEYLRGARCFTVTDSRAANLEAETADFLGRLRFDGGQLNRNAAAPG